MVKSLFEARKEVIIFNTKERNSFLPSIRKILTRDGRYSYVSQMKPDSLADRLKPRRRMGVLYTILIYDDFSKHIQTDGDGKKLIIREHKTLEVNSRYVFEKTGTIFRRKRRKRRRFRKRKCSLCFKEYKKTGKRAIRCNHMFGL